MLKLKVITPDKIITDEVVDSVTLPTTSGMITVLNKHVALVSTIKSGEMVIKKGGKGVGYSVYKGLVNVRPNFKGITEVVVLLERGEMIEELDHDRAEEALKRAIALKEENAENVEFSFFEGHVEKELNRVKISRKYRNRGFGVSDTKD
jgi:F-type H+-transporting ATPase subunit epsilon